MRYGTSIVFAAVAALSQVAAQIHFQSFPDPAVPSTSNTLTWTGGDSTETITITLKKAGAVVATLLQRNGQATSFDWTPASTLAGGDDYTLEISQGSDSSETPDFTIGAVATSSAETTITASATATSVAVTTLSTSAVVTSLSTVEITTTTVAAPITTIAPVGNITSSGSILPISTFTSLPGNATTTAGSGSNSTGTASSTSAPTATITPSNGAAGLGSSLTLLVGAAAAFMFFC